MVRGWLVRLRWRRRGDWLWPAFVAVIVLDTAIAHGLPASGDAQTFAGAVLSAMVANLIAVVLLPRPLGALIRRRRPDLPMVVARDYGGRMALLAIAALFLLAGLVHRPAILHDRATMRDAISRAQAYIGDRAPAEFRRNLTYVSTFVIEPGHVFRTCVPGVQSARTYCVIVKTDLPFAHSVSFGGYEPNAVFSAGTN
jgi:hypothetical protein